MIRDDNFKETQSSASKSLKERSYWTDKLSKELNRSSFKNIPLEDIQQTREVKSMEIELSRGVNSRLIEISNGSDMRLHMILVAGVMALLRKSNTSDSVMLGTGIFETDAKNEYLNTILPLKMNVENEMSFKSLIIKIRELIMEAVDNQNYPIKKLLQEIQVLQPEEGLSLFDVAVILENIQDAGYIEQTDANVSFIFKRVENSLKGALKYNSNIYDEVSINKIAEKLNSLLTQVMDNLELRIEDIDLISKEEEQKLLHDFNETEEVFNSLDTIYELFERQVEMNPNNIAVVYQENQISYNELNNLSNHLANVIVNKGARAECLVGIVNETSIETIIGILAVLKAGAAYVPIDMNYPKERIEYMLKDSNVDIILSNHEFKEAIDFDGEILCFDTEIDRGRACKNLEKRSNGSNMAYIMYTSGSTGKPKGVMIEHGSIVNSVLWRNKYFQFSKETAILQPSSFSFDTSVLSTFTALTSGAKLVLINQEDLFSEEKLKNTILSNEVKHFSIIPNLYKLIIENDHKILENVESITLVGEKFGKELVQEHFKRLKNVKLYNEYGPAENSVCTSIYECKADIKDIYIGRPISNVKCYVLDKKNKLLPIGVEGELCIAGKGIARGYLNKLSLTNEKFVDCPFLKGEKMYKTGDYVVFNENGNMKFMGRKDDLVKINGCRMELGEIQSQILKFNEIKDAIVVERQNESGGNYLCAYIVYSEPSHEIDNEEVRSFLQSKLPQYMIPSFFVKLMEIPRTLSGKIDKKKLESPIGKAEKIEYVAPRNETENRLCNIYEKVLKIEQVGVMDNYFHIGGDSIKSITIVSIINEEMNVKLEVSDIYYNQTIEEVAAKIQTHAEDNVNSESQYNDVLREMDELKSLIMKGE